MGDGRFNSNHSQPSYYMGIKTRFPFSRRLCGPHEYVLRPVVNDWRGKMWNRLMANLFEALYCNLFRGN